MMYCYCILLRQLHRHDERQNSEDTLSEASSSNDQGRRLQIQVESPPNGGLISSIASSFNSEKSVIYDSDEMSDRIVSV